MLHKRKIILQAHKYNTEHKTQKRDCQFCDISQVENVVDETPTMRVIRNHFPYDNFEGVVVHDHLMVIPKQHRVSLTEFTKGEKLEYIDILAKYEADEYSVYSRGGKVQTRSVEHLHTHLLNMPGKRVGVLLFISKPYLMLRSKERL